MSRRPSWPVAAHALVRRSRLAYSDSMLWPFHVCKRRRPVSVPRRLLNLRVTPFAIAALVLVLGLGCGDVLKATDRPDAAFRSLLYTDAFAERFNLPAAGV